MRSCSEGFSLKLVTIDYGRRAKQVSRASPGAVFVFAMAFVVRQAPHLYFKLVGRAAVSQELRNPLNKSVTWVFISARRSCEGRNLKRCGQRFLLSQERRGEGAGV